MTTTRKARKKEFYGEASGLRLVHWLNGPGEIPWLPWKREFSQRFGPISGTSESDSNARNQIADLIRKLKQFVEMANDACSENENPKGTPNLALLKWLNDSINNILDKYTACPQITSNIVKDKAGRLKPFLEDRGPYLWGSSPTSTAEIQETVAVSTIQDAEKQGWLNQVRECSVCGRWFFARRHASNNCSPACHRKEYQSSEKYKEWRHKHYLNHEKQRRIKKQAPLDPRRDK